MTKDQIKVVTDCYENVPSWSLRAALSETESVLCRYLLLRELRRRGIWLKQAGFYCGNYQTKPVYR